MTRAQTKAVLTVLAVLGLTLATWAVATPGSQSLQAGVGGGAAGFFGTLAVLR